MYLFIYIVRIFKRSFVSSLLSDKLLRVQDETDKISSWNMKLICRHEFAWTNRNKISFGTRFCEQTVPKWGVCSRSESLIVSVFLSFYSMESGTSLKRSGIFWWLVKNRWGATTHIVLWHLQHRVYKEFEDCLCSYLGGCMGRICTDMTWYRRWKFRDDGEPSNWNQHVL